MNLNRKFRLITFIFTILITISIFGCGGGGGDGEVSIADIRATLCPGSKTQEGGGKENVIFASINRSGMTGYIENSTGTKVPGSDLISNSFANTSEIMCSLNSPGAYKFVYYVNSERFELNKSLIQWTTLPDFSAPPAPTWDSTNRMLTVNYNSLPAGRVNYYLRLYYANSLNTMYDQTSSNQGGGLLTLRVNVPDNFTPVLVADVIENDQVVATVRYIFTSMLLN